MLQAQSSSSLQPTGITRRSPHAAMEEPTGQQWMGPQGGTAHGYPAGTVQAAPATREEQSAVGQEGQEMAALPPVETRAEQCVPGEWARYTESCWSSAWRVTACMKPTRK